MTWEGIRWAFTTQHASNWHPLTWVSHMLDCQLFGMDLGWHHLMSVCIHAINGVLLFLLLLRMTTKNGDEPSPLRREFWKSAFVAALFSWHPLRVESVAWLSERKDVLCAFFGLLTLLAYVRYAQSGRGSKVEGRVQDTLTPSLSHTHSRTLTRPSAFAKATADKSGTLSHPMGEGWGEGFSPLNPQLSTLNYLTVLVFFALGLMSKPMLVTLPFILLLLDYWPLRRFRELPLSRLVLEKLPFLLLSAASCAVTFVAQSREHSVAPLERIPMGLRFENAAVSYIGYLFKLVWPANLSVIYPFPKQITWTLWLPALILLIFISWSVWRVRDRKPQWIVGWFWYLGMMIPVIGLVQVGAQSMADRYTYLPLIGVAGALTFGVSFPNTGPWLGRAMRFALPTLILAGCLAGTSIQLRHWRDSESLFNHALAVTKENSVAVRNLATVLFREGRMDEALPHLRKAIELDRYDTEAGRFADAVASSQKVLDHLAAGKDNAKTAELKHRIEQYKSGEPFRDPGLGVSKTP